MAHKQAPQPPKFQNPIHALIEDTFLRELAEKRIPLRGTDEQFARQYGCGVDVFRIVARGLVNDGFVLKGESLFDRGVPTYQIAPAPKPREEA